MAEPQKRNYQTFSLVDATQPDFNLDAGLYGLTFDAAVWGTATLQRVLPGPILVVVATALAADGYATVWLPAGKYRLTLAGITDLSGAIELIRHGSH